MSKKRLIRKSISVLLSIVMILTGINLTGYGKTEVYAQNGVKQLGQIDIANGNILISSTGYKIVTDMEAADTVEETQYVGDYTITGTTDLYKIVVKNGSHSIIIQDLKIDLSGDGTRYNQIYRPIDFSEADECKLVIKGTNTIKAGGDCPGIYVPDSKKITIKGDGTLNVYGGESWPGIGRNGNGSIEIQGGIITSYGGKNAAGIGGSFGFAGGKIDILGGDVIAVAGENAIDIGGGAMKQNKYELSISGGSVHRFTALGDTQIKLGEATMKINSDTDLEFIKGNDGFKNKVNLYSGNIELSGNGVGYAFKVMENCQNVDITLNNFQDDSSFGWINTFEVCDGGKLNLHLAKDTKNVIYCGSESSAIRVNKTASLVIDGKGKLTAGIHNGSCSAYSAVIGSQYTCSYGNITINDGIIYADSPNPYLAAAIGTANYYDSDKGAYTEGTDNGIIAINGGEVHANIIGGIESAGNAVLQGTGGAIIYTDKINANISEYKGVTVNSSGEHKIYGEISNFRFVWREDYTCEAVYIHLNEAYDSIVETEECIVTSQINQPNCENAGTLTYTATTNITGEQATDEKVVVYPAREHSYRKELVENATCTKDGYYKKVCNVCGYISEDGWHTIEGNSDGLNIGREIKQISSNGTKLWTNNVNCGGHEFHFMSYIRTLSEEEKEQYANLPTFDGYVTIFDYTVKEDVRKIKLDMHMMMRGCEVRINGEDYNDRTVPRYIEAEGKRIIIQMKLSENSSSGMVDGCIMEMKGFNIPDDVRIPSTGHNYATWTSENAQTHASTCVICGENVSEAHNWNLGEVTTAPTETATGVKTYTCTVCGQTKTETIPALPQENQHVHSYGDWEQNDANTHKKVCAGCGDVITEVHSWDSGTITVSATQETEGIKTYTCTVCGQTKTETIPALPQENQHVHSYGAWEQNDANTHKKVCTGCGDVITEVHSWDSGTITVSATQETEGIKTYTCTVCGQNKIETIPKLAAQETVTNDDVVDDDLEQPDEEEEEETDDSDESAALAVGTTITDTSSKAKYVVVDPKTFGYTSRDIHAVVYKVPTDKKRKDVSIPNDISVDGLEYVVVAIADSAFKNNTKLEKLTIGNNVKTIGNSAFAGCSKLKTVGFRKTSKVQSIGKKAFYKCTKISTITIPKSVVIISDSAFENCSALASIKTQSGSKLKSLGKATLKKCTSLKSITLPANIETIGSNAFYNCSKLQTIVIKSTKLKSVGANAFKGIKSNAKIKVPSKKLSAYKKLLKGKGQGKNVKITK